MTEVSDTLYEDVASYLNFTWTDPEREKRIKGHILSSANYIDYVANKTFVYEGDNADQFARELLFNRVLYADSQALDDFHKNYVNELNTLRIMYGDSENAEDN